MIFSSLTIEHLNVDKQRGLLWELLMSLNFKTLLEGDNSWIGAAETPKSVVLNSSNALTF